MKTYGIYLAFPPTIDLRSDGLGRHLAELLREAKTRDDVRFVIACPSWMRSPLRQLMETVDLPPQAFEIIGPDREPLSLRLFEWFRKLRTRARRGGGLARLLNICSTALRAGVKSIAATLVSSRNPLVFGLLLLPVAALSAMAYVGRAAHIVAASPFDRLLARIRSQTGSKLSALVRPQSSGLLVMLYRLLAQRETSTLIARINARLDVAAWYCPTAFWPEVNLIRNPKLICVPDVVLADFPVGFSVVGGDRMLAGFRGVEETIRKGSEFTTYSATVRDETLIRRYGVSAARVHVVPHGANRLDQVIRATSGPEPQRVVDAQCRAYLRSALAKAEGSPTAHLLRNPEMSFIFYASQFRPNKNVVSLLRAYEYLLRKRYIGHKLVLTGSPDVMPEISDFLDDAKLREDVLCLRRLSVQELTACYRLADVAVNPSLSEGACPFTLTEALSVGTPVVMADIAVTREVIGEAALRDMMLFDPYDWRAMAERIEWAIGNRDALLAAQLPLYYRLAQRSWSMVMDEQITILDRISSASERGPTE